MSTALKTMGWFLVILWMFMALATMGLLITSTLDQGLRSHNFGPLWIGMAILTVAILVFFRITARFGGWNCGRVSRRSDDAMAHDEAEFFRDFQASLVRMEQRIEALETLLLDRSPRTPADRL